ncbi:MAG: TIR domain-containing protein, partial [bacterium]|nr:TIR domain-containing protein [bacterium]
MKSKKSPAPGFHAAARAAHTLERPRVFLSYSWDSEEYKSWVERLGARLRQDGIDARLDVWHLKEGVTVAEFMNREIRNADKVLVLCSPGMRRKVHQTEDGERMTGTGWEAMLLSSRIFSGLGERGKGIAVLARGAWTESAPDFLVGQDYVDLSDPQLFEQRYRGLLQRITDQTRQAPELGTLPAGLEDQAPAPLTGADSDAGDADRSSSADVSLSFSIDEPGGDGYQVTLGVDEADGVSAAFELDLGSRHKQAARDIRSIEANRCTHDDVMNLGAELWSLLQSGPVEGAIADGRYRCREREGVLKVRLALPPQLEAIPWESL